MAITSRLLARRCSKAAGGLSRLFGMPISTRACLLSEHNVSIDTAGLNRPQSHSHGDAPGKEPETEMAKHIKSIIRVGQLGFMLLMQESSQFTHQLCLECSFGADLLPWLSTCR